MAEPKAARQAGDKAIQRQKAPKQQKPAAPVPPAMPAGLALRQIAARLLAAVVDKKTSLDGLLDETGGSRALSAFDRRDRALLRAILQAALRYRGVLTARLAQLLQRPLPPKARALEHILHIGAAQILYLNVPDHAAIDLAVESARRHPQTKRFGGLVNAVLRRLARQGAASGDAALPAAAFVPPWFWQMLTADYGAEKAEAIIRAQLYLPPLDITVKAEAPFWAEKLRGRLLPFGTVRLAAADNAQSEQGAADKAAANVERQQPEPAGKTAVATMAGFAEGAWWVQNAAASLPARLMGDIKGRRVADLCAAPGGKTAQLALSGASVTAVDISANRLARLRHNMQRLRLPVETWQGDMRTIAGQPGFRPYDAVLLDAPCSATGTIRRHPDIMWTKNAGNIAALAQLQAELLAACLPLVKSGGLIMFCNCSLAKAEGEEVVNGFLRDYKSAVKLLPFTAADMQALLDDEARQSDAMRAQAAGLITEQGFLRTTPADLPDKEPLFAGQDGFFAARLQKL
ncbi:MAG: methyltransferase domain-containing protein [Candidatus Tokpelaia sp.]|nr:MAG: methyltransferase domain-containing protein [Candidatus Tokpelaia sp.]KAA6206889.1 MAG: methyltransferase domain-containing protein [Candidatus Tokpelaia sp.]